MASNTLMSCGIAAVCPSILSSSKSKFAVAVPVSAGATNAMSRFTMSAEWMPGQPRPSYLDGSAPGDFGFDPLGLGEAPSNLERFKESELIHCRWAMLAVVSFLFSRNPSSRGIGLGQLGQGTRMGRRSRRTSYIFGPSRSMGYTSYYFGIEFLAITFVEHQRSMEKDPEKKKYPGGAFDPLGYSKDPKKFEELKVKEIKNGRLALLAFVGFCVQQSAYPGTGPLENLTTHLADPWHNNIGDIVIPSGILPN
ncbi:hypothetical protein RND71_025769 [Anisodus tanguticus]|uniref:Chlorophyll a-b binding protein, chloroplastic n=1 Tax=Anisodus tanguticus TaxID=243964 RepID=A0AAE1VAN4_9SOLA|nr:hypothetical protein RND71_025769 [Anisodus tanguticus]